MAGVTPTATSGAARAVRGRSSERGECRQAVERHRTEIPGAKPSPSPARLSEMPTAHRGAGLPSGASGNARPAERDIGSNSLEVAVRKQNLVDHRTHDDQANAGQPRVLADPSIDRGNRRAEVSLVTADRGHGHSRLNEIPDGGWQIIEEGHQGPAHADPGDVAFGHDSLPFELLTATHVHPKGCIVEYDNFFGLRCVNSVTTSSVEAIAELRAAAALVAALARQVETAARWADQRKALEAIPAARDALEEAAARLGPPPPQPPRPQRCTDCHRTEADAHERWCPHA